jgi:hypothetical protein
MVQCGARCVSLNPLRCVVLFEVYVASASDKFHLQRLGGYYIDVIAQDVCYILYLFVLDTNLTILAKCLRWIVFYAG